jgi:hypothetical protein
MWNNKLLEEVHFWKEFLGQSAPRIDLPMDGQHLVITCKLLSATIAWPGIPNDVKPYTGAEVEEDLFTVAGFEDVLREVGDSFAAFEDDDGEED